MKFIVFLFEFHWKIFPGSNQYASIGSDDGLVLNRWQAII